MPCCSDTNCLMSNVWNCVQNVVAHAKTVSHFKHHKESDAESLSVSMSLHAAIGTDTGC